MNHQLDIEEAVFTDHLIDDEFDPELEHELRLARMSDPERAEFNRFQVIQDAAIDAYIRAITDGKTKSEAELEYFKTYNQLKNAHAF